MGNGPFRFGGFRDGRWRYRGRPTLAFSECCMIEAPLARPASVVLHSSRRGADSQSAAPRLISALREASSSGRDESRPSRHECLRHVDSADNVKLFLRDSLPITPVLHHYRKEPPSPGRRPAGSTRVTPCANSVCMAPRSAACSEVLTRDATILTRRQSVRRWPREDARRGVDGRYRSGCSVGS